MRQPSRRPARSLSSSPSQATRLRMALSPAWRGPAGTSPGWPLWARRWWASSWSCSKRSPPRSPAWPFSRTRAITATPPRCDRRRARPGPSGCVLVLRDGLFLAQRTQIAALAAKSRLPVVYGFREEAEAGGLMAYGADVALMYRRAATYVDRILKGAKPADLPVEQPTKFDLIINLKTAKALGLTIPPSLLQRADQIIQ